jgi:hypothetical protein
MTRAAFHSSLSATPGGLAFCRAMVPDMPPIKDLQLIQEQRQHLIHALLQIDVVSPATTTWATKSSNQDANQVR